MIVPELQLPKRIWIETLDGSDDACDVIVEMEDGALYTAVFVTLNYLRRQMDLGYAVSRQLPDAPPVRYAVLETPHILVENTQRDTIEDTIDNLLALDVFEGYFTQVSDNQPASSRTSSNGSRATQEMVVAVISEVLDAKGD
ncbi:MAG: hypothetical protein ACUVSX_05210 [Aggregatilineales bacterium]